MSAIFGIINKKGEAVDVEMVTRMQSSLLHRAIDGKNALVNGPMMFGHHQLIIHKRQAQESLPFEYDDIIITCDARIDNIEELSKKLDVKDSITITDSLIISKAYQKWGNDCVMFLEGEFTFAIWNKKTETFFGAADHIGFRTFYYYENQKIFAFASEIKALESIKTEPLKINNEIFFDSYTIVYHPITYDINIHVLPSAHYITLTKNSSLRKKQYWLAKNNSKYKFTNSNDWYNCIVKLVTQKIKLQIESDYPIGILLSGGLDSSFVAAIACKLLKEQNKKLIAFSTILPEDNKGKDKDERVYIEKLESFYDNLEVHYISIPADIGPYSNLTSAFEHVESPVNMFHYADTSLYEHAKKHNVRTLLTGFGGDMTLSHTGYAVIFQYLNQFRLSRAAKFFKRRHKETKRTLYNHFKHEVLSHIPLLKKIKSFISKNNDYPSLSLNKKYIKRIISARNAQSYMYNRSYARSINTGELGSLLLKIRKLSNAFQLEFLSPLLCKEITELFMAVPGEELIVNGQQRSLIKGAMKGIVPEEIISRVDKLPFSPDSNKRIVKITPDNIIHWFANKDLLESNTGIDAEEHLKLISKISHSDVRTEWPINKNIFYIPMIVIAAEFYIWLSKKL